MDTIDLAIRFLHQEPSTDERRNGHVIIHENCRRLAYELNDLLPDGREKSLAITNLEQVMFWADAALGRQSTPPASP